MNREIPHPPIEEENEFDDSPYAERRDKKRQYDKNLKEQLKKIRRNDSEPKEEKAQRPLEQDPRWIAAKKKYGPKTPDNK